jgi:HEAT repeat protein
VSTESIPRSLDSGRVGPESPLTDWLIALSHDSPFEKPQVGAAPAESAPPLSAVPGLLSLVKDGDPGVRLRAVAAVGDLARELRRVLPALRAALDEAAHHDGNESVRAEAVRGLLRAGPQSTTEVDALVNALQNKVDVVRFHAAFALGDLGAEAQPALAALIHASLWDEEPAVRVGAARALWKIDRKGPLVLQVLTKALHEPNELVCWIAADCLGQMGPAAREAAPALRHALDRDFKLSLTRTGVQLALERIESQTSAGTGGGPV